MLAAEERQTLISVTGLDQRLHFPTCPLNWRRRPLQWHFEIGSVMRIRLQLAVLTVRKRCAS